MVALPAAQAIAISPGSAAAQGAGWQSRPHVPTPGGSQPSPASTVPLPQSLAGGPQTIAWQAKSHSSPLGGSQSSPGSTTPLPHTGARQKPWASQPVGTLGKRLVHALTFGVPLQRSGSLAIRCEVLPLNTLTRQQ